MLAPMPGTSELCLSRATQPGGLLRLRVYTIALLPIAPNLTSGGMSYLTSLAKAMTFIFAESPRAGGEGKEGE
ncbi:MAG: hypothetical protein DDT36_01655 [Firmicutes bacterium]|nr:hypothetical protein [Bacillota bacterium]